MKKYRNRYHGATPPSSRTATATGSTNLRERVMRKQAFRFPSTPTPDRSSAKRLNEFDAGRMIDRPTHNGYPTGLKRKPI